MEYLCLQSMNVTVYPLEYLDSYPPAVRAQIEALDRAERFGLPNPEWGLLTSVPYVWGKRVVVIFGNAMSHQSDISVLDHPLPTPRRPSVKGNPIERLRAANDSSVEVEAFTHATWGVCHVSMSITTKDQREFFYLFRREKYYLEDEVCERLAETAFASSALVQTDRDNDLTDFYEELGEFCWRSTKSETELDDELETYRAVRAQKLADAFAQRQVVGVY